MSTPCGCEDTIIITNCTDPAPTPPECLNGEKCEQITDAGCVEYTGSSLTNIDVNSGDRLDEILSKLNQNLDTQAIEVEDTNSVNLTGSGLSSDKLKADVKISTDYNEGINILTVKSNGLYAPKGLPVTSGGNKSLVRKVGGVSIAVTSNNVVRQPVFNIKVLNGAVSAIDIIDGGAFTGTPVLSLSSELGSGAIISFTTTGTSPNITINTMTVSTGGTGYKNDHYIEVNAKISAQPFNKLRVIESSSDESWTGLYAESGYLILTSETDAVPDYINYKLVEGNGITIEKITDDDNYEQLRISAEVGQTITPQDTATIDLTLNSGNLSADLKLDAKVLVTPSINPGFLYYQNDDVTAYTSNISQGLGYNDTDPKNPIVDVGASVTINGNYVWTVSNVNTQKAPTLHSGDFATGTLPTNGVNSSPNFNETFINTTVSTVTRSVTISCPKTGLHVENNRVVAASGNESTNASVSIRFKHKYYAGYSTSGTLANSTAIRNMSSFRAFCDDNSVVSLSGVNTSSNQYFYFCYPASFGNLINIIKNDSLPILGAFQLQGTVNFVNDAGFTVSYNVYRTNALNAFSDVSKLSFNL